MDDFSMRLTICAGLLGIFIMGCCAGILYEQTINSPQDNFLGQNSSLYNPADTIICKAYLNDQGMVVVEKVKG